MMIMMIFCPVYEIDSAGNPLSPTKAVRGRVDRFLGGEWRELWKDCQELPGVQVKARPSRGYTEEEEVYRRAQKAKHAVLNGQISDGARALVQPGLLKWSQHIIEQMESIHKVGEEHVDMPVPADGWASVEANDERYGYTASTMEVKMQSGQTKEEPTLPYLLRHLPKYKAPGCVGDRYEHYQAMPFAFVDACDCT